MIHFLSWYSFSFQPSKISGHSAFIKFTFIQCAIASVDFINLENVLQSWHIFIDLLISYPIFFQETIYIHVFMFNLVFDSPFFSPVPHIFDFLSYLFNFIFQTFKEVFNFLKNSFYHVFNIHQFFGFCFSPWISFWRYPASSHDHYLN